MAGAGKAAPADVPAPRRLFGTDGVRGLANRELDADLALGLARAAGEPLAGGTAVIGRDTRRSGEMLASALRAGFHSVGVDTLDAGVIPVGGVSALTGDWRAGMGVMVSASHNPAADNGVKFFTDQGFKFSEEAEEEIENRLREGPPWAAPVGEGVGAPRPAPDPLDRYLDIVRSRSDVSLEGMPLALDCANGAASRAAPDLFSSLGADVEVHYAAPDGMNINLECGATSPGALAGLAGGRIGLAFDGDADRLFVVDEDGRTANGDVVMAVIARHLHSRGRLPGGLVVATVMSNLGFRLAMREAGIEMIETRVGDRYVLEEMVRSGAALGGEQSGHVIFLERARTGDGLLTALLLLEVVAETGLTVRELRRRAITEFPQVLRNVQVGRREDLEESEEVREATATAEAELGDRGRVLVRASGTEPVIRVMVEAPTLQSAEETAARLAAQITQALA